MLIPSGEGEGMVNSQLVTQGNFNSPSRGLAVVVKKRIPTTRGSASRGRNLFFTTPAKPWLGELKLPFVTRWEFIIPTTRGFATRGRNYTIPSPPPEGITSLLKTTIVATLWNNLSCKVKVMAQFLYILYITVNVVTCAKQKSMYSHVSTLTFDQHQFHKFFVLWNC